jgi:cytochrome c-type biogenesis protein CcmH/NrfG
VALGDIYRDTKRAQQAELAYKEVLKMNVGDNYSPSSADVRIRLGNLYFQQNRFKMAENAFLDALRGQSQSNVSDKKIEILKLLVAVYQRSHQRSKERAARRQLGDL